MARAPRTKSKPAAATKKSADVGSYRHDAAKRRMIPTAEQQGYVQEEEVAPRRLRYKRNPDLDPQLVWRGKDAENESDLTVDAPPVYIQEKIHPRQIVEKLKAETRGRQTAHADQIDLFADFNGRPADVESRTEFYQHDQNWQNRMILGDALLVMGSLAEREGMRGKVQCIYMDPPYGIRFNSNWQASTASRDVKDGSAAHVSREPEVIRAFRDTWKDGIHSYLSYLRDRLVIARDLLTDSGSIFVQIGDENVHVVRSLMDEVFGRENFVSLITVQKAGSTFSRYLGGIADFLVWYGRDVQRLKYRELYKGRGLTDDDTGRFSLVRVDIGALIAVSEFNGVPTAEKLVAPDPLQSASIGRSKGEGAASWFAVEAVGRSFKPTIQSRWKTNEDGMLRLIRSDRIIPQARTIRFARRLADFPVSVISNIWSDLAGATDKTYVVQTATKVVERCVLMTTDPGDLVLDPTCGSGTSAYVAEQWGRRWITIDTSRVALALARARLMGARYSYYLLRDSAEGAAKEAALTKRPPSPGPFTGDLRQGFVYERAPHVTLKSIANNADIDTIWERWQGVLEPLRAALNAALGQKWEEWEIPREAGDGWPAKAKDAHAKWWEARRARQAEIDASIARNADIELLYDRPHEDRKTVRVAGPFTVESLSPHRTIPAQDDPHVLAALAEREGREPPPAPPPSAEETDFARVVYEHLKAAGVQNTKKGERIVFDSLEPWAGRGYVAYEGRYQRAGKTVRAAIAIGPEYGAVGYEFVRAAAREARDAFDELIVCGFQFAPEVDDTMLSLGRLTVLKARMNQDIRMGDRLKNTGAGNLFVVFGEPDIEIRPASGGEADGMVLVEIKGVDIFDPTTGEIKSSADPAEDIACWFIDDDYDEESFFVRQAYFLGGAAGDPYKALKRALKAEIDEDAWASLHTTVSRPFPRPKSGRICVKVINHFGDEVQKVFAV